MIAKEIWNQEAIEELLASWCERLAERLGDRLQAGASAKADVCREMFVHLHKAVDIAELLSYDANLFSALTADVERFAAYGAVSFEPGTLGFPVGSFAATNCAAARAAGVTLRLEFSRMYKRPGRVSVLYEIAVHPDAQHRAAWAAYLAAREEAKAALREEYA